MFKRSCLTAVIGIGLFAISLAIPGKAFAATAGFVSEAASPSDPASVKVEHQRYARGGRGGGRGGGRSAGRSRGGRGASSRGARRPSSRPSGGRPSKRPSGGRPGGGRPGAGRPGGGRPGGGRPGGGGNVNINVKVKHRGYGWRGNYWGRVAFGVTLGTAIIVAANTPPYPPNPSLCWTWSNAALTSGYWYYCEGY